jgi:hypothetical protein
LLSTPCMLMIKSNEPIPGRARLIADGNAYGPLQKSDWSLLTLSSGVLWNSIGCRVLVETQAWACFAIELGAIR